MSSGSSINLLIPYYFPLNSNIVEHSLEAIDTILNAQKAHINLEKVREKWGSIHRQLFPHAYSTNTFFKKMLKSIAFRRLEEITKEIHAEKSIWSIVSSILEDEFETEYLHSYSMKIDTDRSIGVYTGVYPLEQMVTVSIPEISFNYVLDIKQILSLLCEASVELLYALNRSLAKPQPFYIIYTDGIMNTPLSTVCYILYKQGHYGSRLLEWSRDGYFSSDAPINIFAIQSGFQKYAKTTEVNVSDSVREPRSRLEKLYPENGEDIPNRLGFLGFEAFPDGSYKRIMY